MAKKKRKSFKVRMSALWLKNVPVPEGAAQDWTDIGYRGSGSLSLRVTRGGTKTWTRLHTRAHDGALHLIVDSTGLKISGAGEWHAHRHELEGSSTLAEAACRRG